MINSVNPQTDILLLGDFDTDFNTFNADFSKATLLLGLTLLLHC